MQDILTGNGILQLPGKRDSLKLCTECGIFGLSKRESKCELIDQAHVSIRCFHETKL